jgi:phosphoserine aminotransferase
MASSSNPIKTWNFSAGPGVIPRPVLVKAQEEMLNFADTGCSLMELSHRSNEFEDVLATTEANLRTLLNIPSNYKVLFMQGGATGQFSAIVYNLIGADLSKPIDYVVTGSWSQKGVDEARSLGMNVNVVMDTKPTKHNGDIPPVSEWKFSGPDAAYVFYCDNETINGVEFDQFPFDKVPANVPVVCDMSSNILSKPIDVSKYGLIFAGAQKNMGPSGVTVVIIREDLIGTRKNPQLKVPLMLDYKIFADNKSMYNTPPTFAIYICGLVYKWLLELGGLSKMAEINKRKADAIYNAIKESQGFYVCPVVKENLRSKMNIPFRLTKNGEPSKELEAEFAKQAEANGMVQLPGHRSVGGMRASLYNALPEEGALALAQFMREFAKQHA